MDVRKRQPIGIELVKKGVVTEKEIERALVYQREHTDKKIGEILHILNLCDSHTLITAIGEILGAKGILLDTTDIKINVLEYISLETALKSLLC